MIDVARQRKASVISKYVFEGYCLGYAVMKAPRRIVAKKLKIATHAEAKRALVKAVCAMSLTDEEVERAKALVAAAKRAKKAQFLEKYRAEAA